MKHWIMALCVLVALNGTLLRAADDDKDKKEAERKAAIEKDKQDRLAKAKEARDAKNKKPEDPKVAAEKAKMDEKGKSEKAMADEKMTKEKALADTKKAEDEKRMKEDAYPDGTKVTVGGKMAIKALDAKAGVVCRLLARGGNKLDRTYNLIASSELATKIEAIRQNGDPINVTGTVYGDDITVEKIN